MPKSTDVTVYNGGSLFNMQLNTPRARAWAIGNVNLEPWQWTSPDSFACDARYAGELTYAMIAAGLEVD